MWRDILGSLFLDGDVEYVWWRYLRTPLLRLGRYLLRSLLRAAIISTAVLIAVDGAEWAVSLSRQPTGIALNTIGFYGGTLLVVLIAAWPLLRSRRRDR